MLWVFTIRSLSNSFLLHWDEKMVRSSFIISIHCNEGSNKVDRLFCIRIIEAIVSFLRCHVEFFLVLFFAGWSLQVSKKSADLFNIFSAPSFSFYQDAFLKSIQEFLSPVLNELMYDLVVRKYMQSGSWCNNQSLSLKNYSQSEFW